jgi:hypothetical protein
VVKEAVLLLNFAVNLLNCNTIHRIHSCSTFQSVVKMILLSDNI